MRPLAVLAQRLAMIGRDDDQRVREGAGGAEARRGSRRARRRRRRPRRRTVRRRSASGRVPEGAYGSCGSYRWAQANQGLVLRLGAGDWWLRDRGLGTGRCPAEDPVLRRGEHLLGVALHEHRDRRCCRPCDRRRGRSRDSARSARRARMRRQTPPCGSRRSSAPRASVGELVAKPEGAVVADAVAGRVGRRSSATRATAASAARGRRRGSKRRPAPRVVDRRRQTRGLP